MALEKLTCLQYFLQEIYFRGQDLTIILYCLEKPIWPSVVVAVMVYG